MNKDTFNKLIIILTVVIIFLLGTILIINLSSKKKDAPATTTESKPNDTRVPEQPTVRVEPVPIETRVDSFAVVDNYTISRIKSFFETYSTCNYQGLVEEYLNLFTDPAVVSKKTLSREGIRKISSKFFMDNETTSHYFDNIRAYSRSDREYVIYTNEHQESTNRNNSKFSKANVYKRFVLIDVGGSLLCKEMVALSTSYGK
jgi:hypothetical protein